MTTVVFPGRYASLAEIGDFVKQAAIRAGLDQLAVYAVETAVDEACSNIIEHGYCGEGIGTIECTCLESTQGLTIILKDDGLPFDSENVPEPELDVPLEMRLEHGLGLYFMRKWMDEVRFERPPEGGNILTMLKKKPEKNDE